MMLGKRKREAVVATRSDRAPSAESSHNGDEGDARSIFKSYFEAQFAPIEEGNIRSKVEVMSGREAEPLDEDPESEWGGFSEGENVKVEVVDHVGNLVRERDEIEKYELKSFMSSRPPPTSRINTTTLKSSKDEGEDPDTEAANLANDLALQRLLRESHLLSFSPQPRLDHSGAFRHKATDLRLQSLGSKDSIFTQQKMPMPHRKGIVKKGVFREERRRKEAKENGIVLERKGGKEGKRVGKREMEVAGPGVGRWKEGMLRLSGKDVRDIEGPKESAKMKGKRKGTR